MNAPEFPTTLRCVRSGSSVTISVWDSSTSTWQTQAGWTVNWTGISVWPSLSLYAVNGSTVTGTFKNFNFEGTGSQVYATVGTATSGVYDAGRNVAWDKLSWQSTPLPVGTDLKFQLAFSENLSGPWNYLGPNGTAGSYYTASTGQEVPASTIGRYARVKAYFNGNGSATPSLQSVELSYSGSLASQYEKFSYDEAGNLTERQLRTDSSVVTETRSYNVLNAIEENVIDDGSLVTWVFSHDDNGNMTSKTDGVDTWDYAWDDNNRLISVSLNSSPVVEYEYDSKSRLLQRIEGGTTTNYHWLGWNLIKEVKSGVINETTNYLVPAGAFERDGNWFYMHGDALSSTQLVTDENGDQVARFIYGAWGEELYASESVPGILENRFVGGLGCRHDSATGLVYMRHRWYDCQLQRFISRDPIGLGGGANLYKYAANNPAKNVDASGLDWQVNGGTPATTAAEFNGNVANQQPGTIQSVIFGGHGTSTSQNISPDEDYLTRDYMIMRDGEINLIHAGETLDTAWKENLRQRLAPDANVIFGGCHTGEPGGLAQTFSEQFPGQKCWGVPKLCVYPGGVPDGNTETADAEIAPHVFENLKQQGEWILWSNGHQVVNRNSKSGYWTSKDVFGP